MFKRNSTTRSIAILSSWLIDALGISLIINAVFGSTPYGGFVTNFTALTGLSIIVANLTYEVSIWALAYKLEHNLKLKFIFRNLLPALFFGIFLSFWISQTTPIQDFHWSLRLTLAFLGIVLIDTGKYLSKYSNYFVLGSTMLIYILHEKLNLRIKTVAKMFNGTILFFTLILSFLLKEPFAQIGWFSVFYLVVSGMTFDFINSLKPLQAIEKPRQL